MDLKKNGFLVGIIAGLVVAVGILVALVLPAWTEASTQQETVKNQFENDLNMIAAGGKVPTPKWIDGGNAHLGAVNEESKKLYGFYNASDAVLERWFDDTLPQKGVLMSRATDGIAQMLKELRAAMGDANVPADGKATYGDQKVQGFEFPLSADVADELEAKKKWQRVYNIHARMKDALLEAKAQRFYKVQFSKVAGPPQITARMNERVITNDLGMTIPFVVEASFAWKDLPAFTNAILRYDPAKPGPMFRIVAMNVERDLSPQWSPKAELEIEVEKAEREKPDWKEPVPVEPALRVNILVEAYNFNFPEARLK
ncbi:MAG: hypothetical protein IT452_14000 [Planctomycetia bacterium]|nr:hypothetical protein [Planctomycetia bacterium]